jgi:hypothetical protein
MGGKDRGPGGHKTADSFDERHLGRWDWLDLPRLRAATAPSFPNELIGL